MILAIDPGKKGGLAWGPPDNPDTCNMPETISDLCATIKSLNKSGNLRIFLEEVGGYAGGEGAPGSAMFEFAKTYWATHAFAAAFELPLELVRPQKWQKALSLGTRGEMTKTQWKNKLKAKAQQLFPKTDVTLATADALLILHAASRGLI